MLWEKADDLPPICPVCGGSHIRVSRMIEQVFHYQDGMKTLDPTFEDYADEQPTMYKCMADDCQHDWSSDDNNLTERKGSHEQITTLDNHC